MKRELATRRRRGLRVLRIALASGGVGGAYGFAAHGAVSTGAMTGAIIGGLLAFIRFFLLGSYSQPALVSLPFPAYIALRVGIYSVVVVFVYALLAGLAGGSFDPRALNRGDVEFALSICVAANLLFGVNELLGPGVLFAFAAGRYMRPRREERAVLYVDLKGSTGIAERLGETSFLDFLNAFFADVTVEIEAEGGDVHKYVGDGVIAVWRADADPARPISAAFAAKARIAARENIYGARFSEIPDFRAAIHAGAVVVGELGASKKEIALIGDAMNTAARILQAARETRCDILISATYFDRLRVGREGLHARRIAPVSLSGKSAQLPLVALSLDRGGLSAALMPT